MQYNSSSSTLSSIISDADQSGGNGNGNFNYNNKANNCDHIQIAPDPDGSRPSTPPPSPLGRVQIEELISQSIDVAWWCKIVDYSDFKASLSHAEIIFDRDSDWFFVRLNSFSLTDESDVEFEFFDTVDDANDLALSFWRHTMVWDNTG